MRQDVLNQLNIIVKGGDFVNKSAIARMMDCDPRTIKRYLDGYVPKKKRKKAKQTKSTRRIRLRLKRLLARKTARFILKP